MILIGMKQMLRNADLYKSEALDIANVAKRIREAIFKFNFCVISLRIVKRIVILTI